jgi:cation-transporting ATPase E
LFVFALRARKRTTEKLMIFVELPTEWWAGGDTLSGDWKPTILAAVLMVVFTVINVLPQGRALFALAPLGWIEVYLVAGAVALWLPLARLLWRKRLMARFLGLDRAFADGVPQPTTS